MPYQKINWQNGPAGGTPVNKTNLNRMDSQIAENEADIEELKSRPGGASLILTGQRRLTTSEAGKIAGLDVKGKSSQEISNNIANPANIKKGWFSTSSKTIDGAYGTIAICRVKPNTSYTYSKIAGDRTVLGLGNYDGDISEVGVGFTLDTVVSQRTVNTGSHNVLVVYANSEWSQAVADVIMVNEGTAEIPFEPYTGQPAPDNEIPIVNASGVIQAIGKNLFDPHYGYHTSASGFVTDYAGAIGAGSDLIPCNSGDNYVFTMTAWSGAVIWVGYYNSSKGFINRVAITNGAIITIPSGTSFFFVSIYASNITPESYPQVMLELGTTATAYEPYQSNQIDLSAYDLRSVEDIADQLIVYPDKTGKLIKRVTSAIYDGSEADWKQTATDRTFYLEGPNNKMGDIVYPANSNNAGVAMCSHFTNHARNGIAVGQFALTSGFNTMFYHSSQTINEWKTWLAANNITIYAVLKTPIETDLTAEQVAEILALETYAPETIIETELDVQGVGYTGDVKGYIDSKFEYSYTIRKIGKWADGKDFYQAVINTTTPSTTALTPVFSGFNSNNAELKNVYGTIKGTATAQIPINCFINSTYYAGTWLDASGLCMSVGSAYTNKPCEITVEFTYKDAAPAAASVMALTDDDIQSEQSDDGLKKGTIIDDTVVYGGN